MSALTKEFAYQVYLQQYFIAPQFDKVATLSEVVAQELCDIAVNMGPSVACPMLQESLNLLNRGQQDYLDMQVDGHIGKETLMALAAFLVKRGADGEKVLGRMLYIMKGERYITLAKAKPSQENFLFGWILNRVGI
jgi:lysozyme family protein